MTSSADANTKLAALTPAERRQVVADGMTPAYSIAEARVVTVAAAAAATRRRYATFTCKHYSSVGVHVYNYVQDWWWDYTGNQGHRRRPCREQQLHRPVRRPQGLAVPLAGRRQGHLVPGS